MHHEEIWNVTCHNPFRQPVKEKEKKKKMLLSPLLASIPGSVNIATQHK